jgi:hypothetical protein
VLNHPLEASARRRSRRLATQDLYMVVEQSCRALEQATGRHRKEPGADPRKDMKDALVGALTASDEIFRREAGAQ